MNQSNDEIIMNQTETAEQENLPAPETAVSAENAEQTGQEVSAQPEAEKAEQTEVERLSCAAKNYSGPCKKTSIGGQALIEGIMMRGPERTAIAVRRPGGELLLEYVESKPKKKNKFISLPIIRGIIGYVQSMMFGYKALMRSAELSIDEDADEEKTGTDREADSGNEASVNDGAITPEAAANDGAITSKASGEATDGSLTGEQSHAAAEKKPGSDTSGTNKDGEKKDGSLGKHTMTVIGIIGVVLGVGLAVFLFVWLPAFFFDLFNNSVSYDFTKFKGLFENTLKILLLVGYMAAVSMMKDIRRTFKYHGAEHKTIACYESGQALTVENCRKMRRFHPRCGTSFLILMLLVSILISTLLILFFPALGNNRLLWVTIKIVLIPFVCGLGYELIKFCGRHDNILTKIISAPGMWLQRITTKEPDDSMLEAAIVALTAVMPENKGNDKW